MTVDRDDEVLASLARLRTCDISQRRARQLRRRCHAVLQGEPASERSPWMAAAGPFRRVIVPALAGLPALHKDPFDRILIAQAKAEGLGLVTPDGPLSDYPVQTIW